METNINNFNNPMNQPSGQGPVNQPPTGGPQMPQMPPIIPEDASKKRIKILTWILIILIVIAISVFGYLYFGSRGQESEIVPSTETPSVEQEEAFPTADIGDIDSDLNAANLESIESDINSTLDSINKEF